MKKRLLYARILLLGIILMVIGCMAVPTESCVASKKLGQVKKVSVKSISCKTVKISWKKAKGAKGYQIYRATKQNGRYKKVKTTKGTVYTDKNLKQGKRYYYKIRAYADNRMGKHSKAKSVVVNSHNWISTAAKGHYETRNIQVPFSQASAPWNQTYNDYVCLCNSCQTKNIRYNSEADLMEHMNEVNSPGWVEEVYESHDFCNNCGKDIDVWFGGDAVAHTIQCGPKGWTNKVTLVRTIEHRATAKRVWVQDTKKNTYCTKCGICK